MIGKASLLDKDSHKLPHIVQSKLLTIIRSWVGGGGYLFHFKSPTLAMKSIKI